MESPKTDQIQFAIRRIKDISFSIHENRISPDAARLIKIEFQNTVSFNVEKDNLIFTLRVFYHYDDEPLENILLDAQVQNVFVIQNLKRFLISPTELDLPDALIPALVAMTVSHTRAMIAKNSAGTALQDTLIPIVNAIDISKHFFPGNFKKPTVHEKPKVSVKSGKKIN